MSVVLSSKRPPCLSDSSNASCSLLLLYHSLTHSLNIYNMLKRKVVVVTLYQERNHKMLLMKVCACMKENEEVCGVKDCSVVSKVGVQVQAHINKVLRVNKCMWNLSPSYASWGSCSTV